jgi:trigger factor
MIVKNTEKKEHSTVMFQVEVDPEAFEAAVEKAYRRNKGSIFVAGFRKGKAPRAVIEGMYGPDTFFDDAAQILAPDAFDFGVADTKLDNVGKPAFVDFKVEDDKSVTLTFSTEVYPEMVLGEYMGLEAVYDEKPVTEEDVETELDALRKRNVRMLTVERPVEKGDTVVLDYEGFVDGVPFEGGKAENQSLEIGSGTFIPGFEDQLIGMELEQNGEIKVTFPEQYVEHLAGKDAVFKIKIHEIREPQYPDLDDEFAKDVSEFDTLEAYKNDIREKLEKERHESAENTFRSALVYKAARNAECDVPESLVEEKLDGFLRGYAESLGIHGNVSKQDILKMLGMEEKSYTDMMRPNAVMQVKGDVLLDKIVEVENIEVGQEEKDEFYKKIDEDYGEQSEKVRAMIDEALMVRDLARQKAVEMICGSAVRKAPEAAKESEAEEMPAEEKQD